MTSPYPSNPIDQSTFWASLQDELVTAVVNAAPIVVTQDSEPDQAAWETAWSDAGNSLPIPASQRFLWYDGKHLRGEYVTVQNDQFCTVCPLNAPNYVKDMQWRSNGDLIALVQEDVNTRVADDGDNFEVYWPPSTLSSNTTFTGVCTIGRDGKKLDDLFNIASRRWHPMTSERPVQSMYLDRDSDVVYILESAPTHTWGGGWFVRARPTASNGYFEPPAFNTAFVNGVSYIFTIFMGSSASSSVTVTVSVRDSTTNNVLFSQGFVIPAGSKIQRYDVASTASGMTGTSTILKMQFSAPLPANEYIYIGLPYAKSPADATGNISPYFSWGGSSAAFLHSYSPITVSNMEFTDVPTYQAKICGGYHVIKRNLTTGAYDDDIIVKGLENAIYFSGTPQGVNTDYDRIIGVDSTGKIYIVRANQAATGQPNWASIIRYDPSTDMASVVYNSATFTNVLFDLTSSKIVLGRGDANPGIIMNLDGSSQTTMTGLYKPAFIYNGRVYGRVQGASWPGQLHNQLVMWNIQSAVLESYASPYPKFDILRESFIKTSAIFPKLQARPGIPHKPSVALRPLTDPLPTYLSQKPNSTEFLAYFGAAEMPQRRAGVATLIYDGGDTGIVRRVTTWASPNPEFWTLYDFTLDTDFDMLEISLSEFDLSHHEILMITVDNNCVTANDTLYVQFNGDTGFNYRTLTMRTSNTTINRSESVGSSAIALPAPNSAVPSTYTLIIPGFQDDNVSKSALIFGGQHLGLTTGNLQAVLAYGLWAGTDPITTIRLTTATAGRRLRAGGRVTFSVLKTMERHSNDGVYTPGVA
jgi:hypothetical protein